MHEHLTVEYQIGIICALPKELKAVKAILDEEHKSLKNQDAEDHNTYVLGQAGGHKVVLAGLPAGVYGTNAAASIAKDMSRTFPHLRFGLLVGIGGGIPSPSNDIRLGDVVVSEPNDVHGGVVQYDLVKDLGKDHFKRIGVLNKPPRTLLTALTALRANLRTSPISEYLEAIDQNYPAMREDGYCYQGADQDCIHCSKCDPSRWWWVVWMLIVWLWPLWQCDCDDGKVRRPLRSHHRPVIHYGTIASANTLLKNAKQRDQLRDSYKALCVDMEAAGLMDEFPCLVIRGVCDYADSYKNDVWQEYAALTAAAFAKYLLNHISAQSTKEEKPVHQILDRLNQHLDRQELHNVQQQLHNQRQEASDRLKELQYQDRRYRECHQLFRTSNYESQKDMNPSAVTGTCRWVLDNPQYSSWLTSTKPELLWVSADPGCGKSVLSRFLVDVHLQHDTICYYFFKDNEEQNGLATALCAILHQIFSQQATLIRHALPIYSKNGRQLQNNMHDLWQILDDVIHDAEAEPITCIIDALDECRESDRAQLVDRLSQFYNASHKHQAEKCCKFRWLVTSRPYDDIRDSFDQITSKFPYVRLRGEDESDQLRDEINIVIKERMKELSRELRLNEEETKQLMTQLLEMEHRTYLWLYLAIDEIKKSFRRALRASDKAIPRVPASVEEAYESILRRVVDGTEKMHAKTVLTIIVGARRPLTLGEMAVALDIATMSTAPETLTDLTVEADHLDESIRRWCGLFVLIAGGRIYLLHQTAKEFLLTHNNVTASQTTWKHCLRFLDVEVQMAKICVRLLCLHDFNTEEGRPVSGSDQDCVATFFEFAAMYWADYVRSTETVLDKSTRDALEALYDTSSPRCRNWVITMFQARNFHDLFLTDALAFLPDGHSFLMDDLKLAAFVGHNEQVRRILADAPSKIDLVSFGGQNATRMVDSEARVLISVPHGGYQASGPQGTEDLHLASLEGHILTCPDDEILIHRLEDRSALMHASANGHTNVVQTLLNKGADVEVRVSGEACALYWAAQALRSAVPVIELLLEHGADVNCKGGYCGSPLFAALSVGNVDVVKVLLQHEADANSKRGQGGSPLWVASQAGDIEIVDLLLQHGADVNISGNDDNYNILCAVSDNGHVDVLKLLLQHGADINVPGCGNPLYKAACVGLLEAVEVLLQHGADAHVPGDDNYGNALYAASENGHVSVVRLLLQHGTDTNVRGGYYGSALCTASINGHINVMELLLRYGADINIRVSHFGNALCAASMGRHADAVQLLLDHGADVNSCNKQNQTALVLAATFGDTSTVKILLDHGADIHVDHSKPGSPFRIAKRRGHYGVVKLLADYGVHPGIENEPPEENLDFVFKCQMQGNV